MPDLARRAERRERAAQAREMRTQDCRACFTLALPYCRTLPMAACVRRPTYRPELRSRDRVRILAIRHHGFWRVRIWQGIFTPATNRISSPNPRASGRAIRPRRFM
ncbi:hypothetical protein DM46_1236 [Burkholderia mallei]|nr:hypothetical protein DM46_1236 [Burkholderia mallei]KOT21343.1 hypothetical protein DM52_1247 [Burkholderia mallei]